MGEPPVVDLDDDDEGGCHSSVETSNNVEMEDAETETSGLVFESDSEASSDCVLVGSKAQQVPCRGPTTAKRKREDIDVNAGAQELLRQQWEAARLKRQRSSSQAGPSSTPLHGRGTASPQTGPTYCSQDKGHEAARRHSAPSSELVHETVPSPVRGPAQGSVPAEGRVPAQHSVPDRQTRPASSGDYDHRRVPVSAGNGASGLNGSERVNQAHMKAEGTPAAKAHVQQVPSTADRVVPSHPAVAHKSPFITKPKTPASRELPRQPAAFLSRLSPATLAQEDETDWEQLFAEETPSSPPQNANGHRSKKHGRCSWYDVHQERRSRELKSTPSPASAEASSSREAAGDRAVPDRPTQAPEVATPSQDGVLGKDVAALQESGAVHIGSGKEVANGGVVQAAVGVDSVVADREKLKLSLDFKAADEAEWKRRQEVIQKQREEAALLRKRKRAMLEREQETQNRQKQRLSELRSQQAQEESMLQKRERVRGEVRTELERVAATSRDLCSLLRVLGIPVEGGARPTPQQVTVAYRKALLKFHPDRAAGLGNDVAQQVKNEETFKIISRMKEQLALVPELSQQRTPRTSYAYC